VIVLVGWKRSTVDTMPP